MYYMIPKIIHYCWFGPKPIPETERKCINSWRKYFPNYEFKFWNEDSFNVNDFYYTKQAYESQKYAFVSDYVRVKVLYDFGGIYLDTDEEIIGPFEEVLKSNKNFVGFVTRKYLGCGVMGFHKGHKLMIELLRYYDTHPFMNTNGLIDNIANTTILTDLLVKQGLIMDGTHQEINDIVIYNRDIFYPKKLSKENFRKSIETIAIHHGSCSWMSEKQKRRGTNIIWVNIIRPILQKSRAIGLKIIGEDKIHKIEVWIRNRIN